MKIAPFDAFREMIQYFIGVCILNSILHVRLEMQNFSSSVENYFTSERSSLVKYFSTLEEKFRTSARTCNVLYAHLVFRSSSPSREHMNAAN